MLETRPAQTRDYEFASLSQHFHRDANVMGCTVDQGRFRVYSDWRTHGDGFGRMLVHGMPDDDTPNQRTAAGKALGGTSCPRRHTLAALSLSLSLSDFEVHRIMQGVLVSFDIKVCKTPGL